jgi:peptidoglycan/LPS O-acetylase OafA/YrhL
MLPIARLDHQSKTGSYRPDIDGLRAISILLVSDITLSLGSSPADLSASIFFSLFPAS